jgi:hypothetical protein
MMSRRRAIEGTRVHGLVTDSVRTAVDGGRLPRRLLVEPGRYSVSGRTFVFDEPGAYRLEGPRGLVAQRLIPGRALEALLSDVSWIMGYGTTEELLSRRRWLRRARRHRISLACSWLSIEVAGILASSGFAARVVIAVTRDEVSDEDNGHTLVEIHDADQWVLYDPSFRTFFRRHGNRLSLPAWCSAVVDGDYDIEPVPGGLPPLGRFTTSSAALQQRMERLVASEEARRRWYEHIAGVPLVGDSVRFFFASDDPQAERLIAYSPFYRPIAPAAFRALWDREAAPS